MAVLGGCRSGDPHSDETRGRRLQEREVRRDTVFSLPISSSSWQFPSELGCMHASLVVAMHVIDAVSE